MIKIPETELDAILITGPTASGKSALAVKLAREHTGEVVNADSMQVYDTLDVLTARPRADEMEGIAHHLYGTVPAASRYSSGEWLRSAEAVISEIRARGRIPVLVGGTGLYFKALVGGLSDMPGIPDAVRAKWRRTLAELGAPALHAKLAEVERKIVELAGLRETLTHLIAHCHGDARPDCPILDELAGDSPTMGRA